MNKNKLTAALKKKALGAAIAVAVSTPAFADVTMFGIVDIGIGMDRLTMLLTNKQSIQDVLFFPQMKND